MKKTLLEGYHKAEPFMPINKYKSRFAYKIYIKGKPISGLWVLDSVNVSNRTFTYKKYNKNKIKNAK